MTKKKISHTVLRTGLRVVLILAVLWHPLSVVLPRLPYFVTPYYTESVYKDLERIFHASQYRQKHNPAIIPDETLFSYVSGAYLRGLDPILANSEHTPLGKYFLAASVAVFRNDRLPTLVFAVLTGMGIWLLGKILIKDSIFALVPLFLVSIDRLFLNQLVTVPLLDIIQLPFILFAIILVLRERSVGRYPWTWLCIGLVAATKTVVPAMLLTASISVWFIVVLRKIRESLRFMAWFPVGMTVFLLSYIRTFQDGYTFWDFLKFQKWIFLYQKSKLLYPFSSLRLLLLNQWQTWWGDFSVVPADDWSILWPVSTILAIGCAVWLMTANRWKKPSYATLALLTLWVVIYQVFLCLGVVSSRFFLPLLPFQYIISVYMIVKIWPYLKKMVMPAVLLLVMLFWMTHAAHAEYILPYPSYMPGNKLYRVSRIMDRLKGYWYFGDIGSSRYHLGLSDKYLVEAKTLLEYKQYLLAADALTRSDREFALVPVALHAAAAHGKDTEALRALVIEAAGAHVSVLDALASIVPAHVTWTPERGTPSNLPFADMLSASEQIRIAAASSAGQL